MTKKITSTLLRECAEKYESDASYTWQNVKEDLGVERNSGWDTCYAFRTIANSIEQHYIELPTDKDGNDLYIGSTVYDKDGNIYHVQSVSTGKRNVFLSKFGEKKDCAELYCSSNFTITKPDSWERIIRDATTAGCAYLGDTEEDSAFDRLTAEKQQLIARCRKLAGETDE